MDLNFRKIKSDDYSVCAEILMAAYKGVPWNNTWTKKEALLRIEATMSGFNARGYVVEKNDEIIAMCLGRIDYYYSEWNQFCIDEFNVASTHQGSGIGKNLLKFISNVLKNDKINRIFLITGGEQAAKFYKNSGFVKSNDGIMMEYDLQND
ncbi:Acetyltransferase (GNAT) domain-containing protein [Amphibacillus marinus]|uniref:Acetyltransferase (GNAT) domain-containing protein n=1 Tax=Amphibacillus marinus TaxID=872970 RepID=A0A1H8HCJ5_9BACI|nr:GNAT family N-acetyltransferase [Amphibacillus marinus]SEN53942.1 Acetyltransferase (GNAT) domain-containing protein [Amphibacillus marinus]